jgi:hypothetical protein
MNQAERTSKTLIGRFGDKARRWKGDDACYVAKHLWLSKHYAKTGVCEICGKANNSRTEWANISGEYKRERSDYQELCPSCHRKKDLKKEFCPHNHKLDEENVYINSRGQRECKLCIKERRERYAKNH